MAQNDWYFACDGQQTGPVTAVELRQAVEAGRLKPEDLVWQEGMREWLPARKIKGLFEPRLPAVAATPPAAVPAPPPVMQPEPATPFERSASAYQRLREGGWAHPLDGLLSVFRRQFSAGFVVGAASLFGRLGFYGLYVTALAVLGFGVVLAFQAKTGQPAFVAVVWAAALIVWQYAAGRFLTAGERLVRVGPARLGTSALLDCCALFAMLAGLLLLVNFSLLAVYLEWALLILPGLALFILGQYLAIVALNPESLNLTISAEASTSEEALGVLAFAAKASLRAAPVAFGTAVVWLTLKVLIALLLLTLTPESMYPATLASALGLLQANLVADEVPLILVFLLAPLWAYLGYLFYHLAAELLRSLFSVPHKLDQLIGDKPKMEG